VTTKTIGETNGVWAILLKVALLIVPLLIPWGVWVTRETLHNHTFRSSGERFTQLNGAQMEARLVDKISKLPPDDWRDRILTVEASWLAIDGRLDVIERKQERIITLLERLP